MKFTFNETPIIGRAVIKIVCGQWYVITKCGNIKWLIDEIKATLSKYRKGGVLESNFYFNLVKKVHKEDISKATVSIVYQSENGYDVLKKELELLTECFEDKFCLNSNNVPYIPKTIHAKKGSNWLKQNEYLNFMKLLNKYTY